MDKHLELIWKKIDGSLSQSESLAFDALIQDNLEFAKLYKSQINLNSNLKNISPVSAPSDLLSNVLHKISEKKVIYSKEYNSFDGMKIIAIASFAVLSLSILITLTTNLTFNKSSYPEVFEWLNNLSLQIPIQGLENYSMYLLVLLPGLALIWLDKMFRRQAFQVKAIR